MFNDIFSKEKTAVGRLRELDWLKGLTVLAMFINHVHFILLMDKDIPFFMFVSHLWRKLLGPSAFVFCMGMGCVYSQNSGWRDNIRRGFRLLSYGFGLHIFFFPICTLFVYQFTHDNFDLMLLLNTYGSDIFQFAGLSFLLLGAMKAAGLYSIGRVLLVGILLSIFGTFVNDYNVHNLFLNQTIGFFIGNDCTHFPLANWFIYVAAGIAYGSLYSRIRDKSAYHRIVLPTTLLASAVFLYISFNVPNPFLLKYFSPEDFYHYRVGIFDALVDILVVICAISLFAKLPENLPMGILSNFSKHLSNYYIVSWIVIELEVCAMKLTGIHADFPATILSGALLVIATTALTHLGVKLYLKYGKAKLEPIFTSRAYMIAVFAITIAFDLFIINYIEQCGK